LLDGGSAVLPGKRKGAGVYSTADVGLSAFSLFFTQSESFLSHPRSLEEGRKTSDCRTPFGMTKIPTDDHIRSTLDPVHPSLLQPAFEGEVAEVGGSRRRRSWEASVSAGVSRFRS
jgi:hypothetical protein